MKHAQTPKGRAIVKTSRKTEMERAKGRRVSSPRRKKRERERERERDEERERDRKKERQNILVICKHLHHQDAFQHHHIVIVRHQALRKAVQHRLGPMAAQRKKGAASYSVGDKISDKCSNARPIPWQQRETTAAGDARKRLSKLTNPRRQLTRREMCAEKLTKSGTSSDKQGEKLEVRGEK
jgi:hypothetical protein